MKKALPLVSLLFLGFFSASAQYDSVKDGAVNDDIIQLPYDRLIQSAGIQICFGDSALENHALDCALSPDGRWLAVEERYSVVMINTRTNEIKSVFPFYLNPGPLKYSTSTYSGISWYRYQNNDYLLWSIHGGGKSRVVMAKWDGEAITYDRFFEYKAKAPSPMALPNEIALSREGGMGVMYVVMNGNNQVVKQRLPTGDTVWIQDTGVAPYGITIANNKVYVSNWAGRLPDAGDPDVAGVPWGSARVDPSTAATREGSVSVYDPASGNLLKEIVTTVHPNEMVASPDGNYIYLTNSGSDQVTVISTITDEVTELISLRLLEEKNPYFGDSPDGLGISADGKTLYVANGMDNAVAMIKLGKLSCKKSKVDESQVLGFIPTEAYPSSVSILKDRKLFITNLEARGPLMAFNHGPDRNPSYNSHHMMASVSVINVPRTRQLKAYTDQVIALNQLYRLKSLELTARQGVQPKPIPERIGEPSVFKHVLYIIKENRTYDQVLGDMPEGNGDQKLCVYGNEVTPNTHQLAREFLLMDNFMASGKCSAEGHQWTDASIVTDYVEKNVRSWFRSYPHVQTDALVYAPTGFLWDNARNHGKSVVIYGEAAIPRFDPAITWTDIYQGYLKGDVPEFKNETTLSTVRELLSPTFPAYDGHRFPDVLRARTFIDELDRYEEMEGDHLPELMIMALPNDHTGGMTPGLPTPRAMVADNDLALGQIVEAVTHSRFWKNTVIFVLEDDSQAGWDHVSAYRTIGLVISPWSRIPQTVHAPYNQPSMVRSIEQILGLPPMNIQDAIAMPMFDCFADSPDFTPYRAKPNRVPLDEMNKSLTSLQGKALYYSKRSMEPQFQGIDTGNDQLFNRILWFAAKGNEAYPVKYVGSDDKDDDERPIPE